MDELLNHLDFWLMLFTFGAMGYFLLWKDHIQPFVRSLFPPSESGQRSKVRSLPLHRRPIPLQRPDGKLAGSVSAAETERNETETHFDAVSGVATPNNDAETVSFRVLAKLIQAKHVTETEALETVFGVKAGSSKAYQEARAKLKRAIEAEATQGD